MRQDGGSGRGGAQKRNMSRGIGKDGKETEREWEEECKREGVGKRTKSGGDKDQKRIRRRRKNDGKRTEKGW